ncbi:putative flavoprotein involved in K+ transport [Haloactinopolyspora alba]|uniref:Putative flavoprotein involved in K+ transport n=1 Tax=Haloactinopolyspora alba TaxID=648780 RepID=A0A2P8DXX7_9ACTN|nr:NAD(P)-binding domain-containing protein [Haloactinopolyspora alba]PSL02066.1 putative flavoprotein involved in K+ transport [Haloactinopolyspora alba]
MTIQHIETLIIGAGQAGLATGHHLARLDRPFLILDGNRRVGDNWRCHWDSLQLFTPAKYDGLPGMPFPGDRWSLPGKDDVADYLEAYALEMDLPVRLQTRVDRIEARREGGFTAQLGAGSMTSDNVVVATGTRGRTPHVPGFARDLAPSIRQLHSTEYRRPSQLNNGPTLVVGASHSGCEIAYELAEDRPVTLCGRYTGKEPFTPGSGADRIFMPLLVLAARHALTRRTPLGRKVMRYVRGPHHGAPMARIKRPHLAERGVRWLEQRVTGVSEDGKPVLADGTVADVTTVIWCTGFEHHFEWIDLPVFDEQGWPHEYRGAVQEAPGLFFCGLVFQYSFSSMVLPGIGRDAAYVAGRIADRNRNRYRAAA